MMLTTIIAATKRLQTVNKHLKKTRKCIAFKQSQ